MATIDQINQVLATFGIAVPEFIVQAALDKVASVSACITGNYGAADQLLIECYAAALIAGGSGCRQVASQHAPNGASQSFKYSDRGMEDLRRALETLDTSGCTSSIVPPDTSVPAGYFDVVPGL